MNARVIISTVKENQGHSVNLVCFLDVYKTLHDVPTILKSKSKIENILHFLAYLTSEYMHKVNSEDMNIMLKYVKKWGEDL